MEAFNAEYSGFWNMCQLPLVHLGVQGAAVSFPAGLGISAAGGGNNAARRGDARRPLNAKTTACVAKGQESRV